jgi:beta-1,4-mannosyl-glycoprotein beta-1,4-N-acetylglucosaminyltransferase
MARPLIIDAFIFSDELDILEMRLTELYDSVDRFVLAEATRTFQDTPKPLWYDNHKDRFAPWADKIEHIVIADGELPSVAADSDPWCREHAHREHLSRALVGLDSNDIVLLSDVDEIPRPLLARNVRPEGILVFRQRFHCFAVDWRHPQWWLGTTAATVSTITKLPDGKEFAYLRAARLKASNPPHLRDAGWHFTWLGGTDSALNKLASFSHPEIGEVAGPRIRDDYYRREGHHVDGTQLVPVTVDTSWPKWIVDGHAPAVWFRDDAQ